MGESPQKSGASFPLFKYFLSWPLPLMATNSTFSIKAHFLIWSYQACNNSYKLVTCMATNLVLDKIKLLKIKYIFPSYIQRASPDSKNFGLPGNCTIEKSY